MARDGGAPDGLAGEDGLARDADVERGAALGRHDLVGEVAGLEEQGVGTLL